MQIESTASNQIDIGNKIEDKKLKESCRDFEAIFIYQLLSQMRSSIPKGGLFQESQAEKIYQSMLDEEYSKVISRSGDNLGLGEMLYRQLKRDMDAKSPQEQNKNDEKKLGL